jgi:hypothetical protein
MLVFFDNRYLPVVAIYCEGCDAVLINWTVQPFGPGWEDVEPDPIVWVNIALVEAAFKLDPDHYVGFGGSGAGQPSRYAKIGRELRDGHEMWMPNLHLHEGGIIRFTDGRHRFAWVRDHGGTALPVATDPDSVHGLGPVDIPLLGGIPLTSEI